MSEHSVLLRVGVYVFLLLDVVFLLDVIEVGIIKKIISHKPCKWSEDAVTGFFRSNWKPEYT